MKAHENPRCVLSGDNYREIIDYPFRWAESPEPLKDELLSSWMTRVMLSNLTNFISIIHHQAKDKHPYLLDLDMEWNPELMELFMEKVGYSQEELRGMMLVNYKKSIDSFFKDESDARDFSYLWITTWNEKTSNGMRFCPTCLKTDDIPYFRKNWRIGYNTFCPIHDCLLENKCPNCESTIQLYRLEWDKKITQCFNCGEDLSKIRPKSIPSDDPLTGPMRQILEKPSIGRFQKVFALAWLIANYVPLTNSIFEKHPLSLNARLVDLWKELKKSRTKISVFFDTQACYLLFGVATSLLQDENKLDALLKSIYSSKDRFWKSHPFICPESTCKKTFYDHYSVEKHVRTHTGEKPFECPVCSKGFATKSQMAIHKLLHNEPHPFSCTVDGCGERFRYEKQYINHLRIQHKIKPYKCKECGWEFDQQDDLRRHVRTHSGKKPYKCDLCGIGFAQQTAMVQHRRTHTGEKACKCEVCGKEFTQNHSLTEHMRIHTGEKPFACKICGKGYKRSHHLESHMRTHTGEKPYKCNVCGMEFADKGNLTKHSIQHTGERPFKCETCGKTFKYRTNLTSHEKSQHSDQKFTCEECGREFKRKDYLKSHIKKKHSNEKPFVCEICGKAYTNKKALQYHMDHHSDEPKYECEHCGKKYKLKGSYYVHKRTKHPIENAS